MDKILSVSIASYNIEKYIEETIGSLIHAEVMDKLEILIISDGSTDKTVEMGKKYEEKYPQTVRVIEKENGGWGSTVNTGIKCASGKYFKLLDGDDHFITENIPGFIKYLETSQVDLVLTPYCEFIDGTNEIKSHISHGEFAAGGISVDELPDNVYLNMHECCFRTEILKKGNIHITEHCFYTDVEFVLKGLSVTGSIGYYNKEIYKYRVASSEQSMSVNGFRKHYKDHLRMTYNMLEFERRYNENRKIKFAISNRLKAVITMQYNIFCLLDGTEEYKKELVKFDKKLKNRYPDYYETDMKKIKFLRACHFRFYRWVCRFYIRKEIR